MAEERELEGTAFRDRDGNIYFIDSDTLARTRVEDPETASVLSERIDEGTEVHAFSLEGSLGFTGVRVRAPSSNAVLKQSFSGGAITRIPSLDQKRGVLLW